MPSDSSVVNALMETVEAIVVVLAEDGEIRDCNRFFEDKSGYSADEIRGRHLANTVLVPEEYDAFMQSITILASGHPMESFDGIVLSKEGDRHQVRWSGVRLDSPAGSDEPPRMLLCGTDITAERQAEKKLADVTSKTNKLQREVRQLKAQSRNADGSPVERRSGERREYRFEQPLAPIIDGQLPTAADFANVRCRDIGAGGFAFLCDVPPGYRDLVVVLGTEPSKLYLTASIKHVTDCPTGEKEKFLVGCEYTGRIDPI